MSVDGAIVAPEGTIRDDAGGWVRTYGATGWYSQTYGGGWYMTDTSWIRTAGNKGIYHNSGTMRTDGTFQVGSSGSTLSVPSGGNFAYRTNTLFANTSGNVGIGTNTPTTALHVKKSGSPVVGTFEGGDNNGLEILMNANTSGGNQIKLGVVDSSHPWGNGFYMYSVTGARLDFFIDTDNGNVGLGTATPDYKLDVNGLLRAKEIFVETGWSDFVFEEGYDLLSLAEVESHIKEKGHLPGIPSAKEVEENGLSVGEVQKLMMQKIEELTLYVLEIKKENQALRDEVAQLKPAAVTATNP